MGDDLANDLQKRFGGVAKTVNKPFDKDSNPGWNADPGKRIGNAIQAGVKSAGDAIGNARQGLDKFIKSHVDLTPLQGQPHPDKQKKGKSGH